MAIDDFFTAITSAKGLNISWNKVLGCPTSPSFHYYTCDIEYNNTQASGTGESFLSNLAQFKALAEALERWAILFPEMLWTDLHSNNSSNLRLKTSNGIAFHLNQEQAQIGAIGELIERDAVLRAYYKKSEVTKLRAPLKWSFLNFINKAKLNLKDVYFLAFPTQYNEYVISCIIENDRFPYRIFGYGHSSNLERAIEKAWTEAWRFFWNLKYHPDYDFNSNDKNPLYHLYYHAHNPINIDDIFKIKKNKNSSNDFKGNLLLAADNIWIADLHSYNLPGFVIQAENKELMELYFGMDKTQKCLFHPIG